MEYTPGISSQWLDLCLLLGWTTRFPSGSFCDCFCTCAVGVFCSAAVVVGSPRRHCLCSFLSSHSYPLLPSLLRNAHLDGASPAVCNCSLEACLVNVAWLNVAFPDIPEVQNRPNYSSGQKDPQWQVRFIRVTWSTVWNALEKSMKRVRQHSAGSRLIVHFGLRPVWVTWRLVHSWLKDAVGDGKVVGIPAPTVHMSMRPWTNSLNPKFPMGLAVLFMAAAPLLKYEHVCEWMRERPV